MSERIAVKDAALPVILIVLGAGWLLNSLHLLPGVHWLWILGLAGAGIGILLLDGLTKSSVVVGPLLILAGVLSFARLYYDLEWRFIIPVMLIAAGLCMLIARSPAIPESRQLNRRSGNRSSESDHG
jgi:hypothetical protein